MPISSAVFMVMAALCVVAGLFAATVAEGYFYTFAVLLMAFGLIYGYGVVKRYYDLKDAGARDAARH